MGRRYRKRRKYRSKGSDSTELLLGSVIVLAAFSYLSGFSVPSFNLQGYFGAMVTVGILVGLFVLTIFVLRVGVRRFFQRLIRGHLFRVNKSVEELIGLHPQKFEEYVGGLYENQGYKVEKVTQYVDDKGIDLVLKKDGKRYAVQAKRYSGRNNVQSHQVREFYGSYIGNDFDEGILITTNYFAKKAREWGSERGMILVDRPALEKMVNKYHVE